MRFVWIWCKSTSPNKGLHGEKKKRVMLCACLLWAGLVLKPVSVFVHSTWAHIAARRDGKYQGSKRKGQGIVVARQRFCPTNADGCFGDIQAVSDSWTMRLPSLFLIEACPWGIHLLSLWFLLTTWCFLENYTSGTTKISALWLPYYNTLQKI